jgi:TonB family protein
MDNVHLKQGERTSSLAFMTGIKKENIMLKKALIISILFHTVLFWIVFPAAAQVNGNLKDKDSVITQFIPPPPKKDQPKMRRVMIKTTEAVIPDPTPNAPEPASEYAWADENSEGPLGEADWVFDPGGDQGPINADGIKVKLPECYYKPIPIYPELARKARIRGVVVVQAVWDTNGRITNARVVSSPGKQFGFDDAALNAIKDWKCNPATVSGRKVEVYGNVTVNFTMP